MLDTTTHINEETKLPLKFFLAMLGAFVALGGSLIGIGMYAATVSAKAESAHARLDKMELVLDAIPRMERSLGKIEGYIEAQSSHRK